jgi:transposase
MAPNFIECAREQAFLMPPSLRDWVSEDHLVWTILEAVEEMDVSGFYADYRADGHGRPAYDPKMMVALLLYAYAKGNRSSRGIERACAEDVAYRVICANHVPDHSTIAEFRRRHETALAELFTSVLSLCEKAGLVRVGVIAIDGTKVAANASLDANRSYDWIVREILREAEETDRAEDERYGEARGDELPERLRTPEGRRAALREAKRELEAERAREATDAAPEAPADEPLLMRGRAIGQGRRGWLREGRRLLDERRAREARPIARSREARLAESKRRLEEELQAERSANEAYESYRSRGVMRDGRRFGGEPRPSKPYEPPAVPTGKINTTDHDSRIVRTAGQPAKQGYNAQAAVSEDQIIVAAEITVESPDFGHLEPMVEAAATELERAGVADPPRTVVADPGYWHTKQMERVVDRGIQVLIPPDSGVRKGNRPGWDKGPYAFMRRVLETEHGQATYRKRMATVEPVIGQLKFNRGYTRFQRRGRSAVRSEWRLGAATHNLLKLHSHRLGIARA